MSSIMGIEISEDEQQLAEDMGLADYIEDETEDKLVSYTERISK